MLEHILEGGWMMMPLLFLSILALAVMIDRLRVFRKAEVDSAALRASIGDCLDRGRVDEAVDACEASSGPVAAVLLVGLDKLRRLTARGRSLREIETNVAKSMADHVPHVVDVLEKRVNLLSLVGSISPLLGMTGTVTGMIAAFAAIVDAGGMQGGVVAQGIMEALVTTAAGLIIAIPSVVAYNIFSKKIDRHVLEIEDASTELMNAISLGEAAGGA